MTGFAKKRKIALVICVMAGLIAMGTGGCGDLGQNFDEISSEVSETKPQETEEPQTQEEESEAETGTGEIGIEETVREIPEIYYGYHVLSENEQTLYLEIFDALTAMSGEVTVSTLDSTLLDKIFECVLNDHPELFYVEGFKYTEHFFGDALTRITFEGTYSMTKEEAKLTLAEIENRLSECMSEVPLNEDEYSTVKFLYDYLIDHTEYDTNADDNQNICSVFLGGRSVCQGYAKAMQYMLQQAGLQSLLVTGYTGTERHAWNLVRVNGNYYYLDPTWGDASYAYSGSEGVEGEVFLPPINYDYFLVTTNEISKTHSFEDMIALPPCDSTQDNYYVREGLYFEGYDRQQLENVFDSEGVRQADYVTLKCADMQVYQEMLSAIIDDRQIFTIIKGSEGAISYASNEELGTISFWNIF